MSKKLLAIVKPSKPLDQMTPEELAAFDKQILAEAIAALERARSDSAAE